MEDIKKFEDFFSWVYALWNFNFIATILICLITIFTGDITCYWAGWAIICLSGVIWWLGRVMINLGRILLTRIVAMTENVLEITQMLEKRFGEGDNANDEKGETE